MVDEDMLFVITVRQGVAEWSLAFQSRPVHCQRGHLRRLLAVDCPAAFAHGLLA